MHRSSVIFPYVRSFALVYFLASAVLAVLLTLLDAAGNVTAWVPALLAGAFAAAARFVRDNRRVPSAGERARFALLAFFVSTLISAAASIGLLVLFGGSSAVGQVTAAVAALGPAVVAGAMLFLFVIAFTTLWLSYGWFAGLRCRALES